MNFQHHIIHKVKYSIIRIHAVMECHGKGIDLNHPISGYPWVPHFDLNPYDLNLELIPWFVFN